MGCSRGLTGARGWGRRAGMKTTNQDKSCLGCGESLRQAIIRTGRKPFQSVLDKRFFCSLSCKSRSASIANRRLVDAVWSTSSSFIESHDRGCLWCNKSLAKSMRDAGVKLHRCALAKRRYCSVVCSRLSRMKAKRVGLSSKFCQTCGKTIWQCGDMRADKKFGQIKSKKFCSQNCASAALAGKSLEVIMKGRFCRTCGAKMSQNSGEKPQAFANRKNCGARCLALWRSQHMLQTDKQRKSRSSAYLRKHFPKKHCMRCASDKALHWHHVNRNKLDNSKDNVEVICKSCHYAEHGAERSKRAKARRHMAFDSTVARHERSHSQRQCVHCEASLWQLALSRIGQASRNQHWTTVLKNKYCNMQCFRASSRARHAQ